jgi:hypothetical protein
VIAAAAQSTTHDFRITSTRTAGLLQVAVHVITCPVCYGDKTRHEGADVPVPCAVCSSRGSRFSLFGAEAETFLNDLHDKGLLSEADFAYFDLLREEAAHEAYNARPFGCLKCGRRQDVRGACQVCGADAVFGRMGAAA